MYFLYIKTIFCYMAVKVFIETVSQTYMHNSIKFIVVLFYSMNKDTEE